jgi:hypothetical protein
VWLLNVDLLKGVAFGSTSINENPSGKADLSLEGLGREFVVEVVEDKNMFWGEVTHIGRPSGVVVKY